MELPVIKLDEKKVSELANEMAMEAVKSELKEFYTSYNSPYRQAIKKYLEDKKVSIHLDLPDIVGLMNDTLSEEITKMANLAVANSYVPLVNDIMYLPKKEINFSEILKKYVYSETDDFEDYTVDIELRDERWGWKRVTLEGGKEKCEFTLHRKDKEKDTYHLLGLPYEHGSHEKMKLEIEGKKIEMPFTKNVLSNPFIAFLASMVISDSTIIMDSEEFEREWFDQCHC